MGSSHELCRAAGHNPLQLPARWRFLAQELFETAKTWGSKHSGSSIAILWPDCPRHSKHPVRQAVRLVVGCRLDLAMACRCSSNRWIEPLFALTRLITLGKSRGGKNNCILHWDDIVAYSEGMIAFWCRICG